ncbi:MAG TPA: response regulator [Bdellovibrionales bacterium]|nr:response regulator [Bdellovibrionales bacterium]
MTNLDKVLDLPHHVSIMVIEDDAMVRAIVVEYLQTFGFTRISAPDSSSEAVVSLLDEKLSYDLVLSDWQMPQVNGLEVLRLCKKLAHRRATKFIMITSQVPEEKDKIAKARAEGVDGYILKPFKGKLLRSKIWEVLGWRNASVA